jgi:hypothetical protein
MKRTFSRCTSNCSGGSANTGREQSSSSACVRSRGGSTFAHRIKEVIKMLLHRLDLDFRCACEAILALSRRVRVHMTRADTVDPRRATFDGNICPLVEYIEAYRAKDAW